MPNKCGLLFFFSFAVFLSITGLGYGSRRKADKMVLFLQPGLLKLHWELGPELGPEVLGQQILLGFNDPRPLPQTLTPVSEEGFFFSHKYKLSINVPNIWVSSIK